MADHSCVLNYSEIAVKEVIGKLYDDFKKTTKGICDCPACRNRAMALSLNILQSYYVTTEAEYAVAKASYDSISERARLIAIVMDSIREVSLSPVHDSKQSLLKSNQPVGYAFT